MLLSKSAVCALLMTLQWMMASISVITILPTHTVDAAAATTDAKGTPVMTASQLRNAAEEALSKQDHSLAIDLFGKLIGMSHHHHSLLFVPLPPPSLFPFLFLVFLRPINVMNDVGVEKSQINFFKRASVYIRKRQYGNLSSIISSSCRS
jgi:hypothetical protein